MKPSLETHCAVCMEPVTGEHGTGEQTIGGEKVTFKVCLDCTPTDRAKTYALMYKPLENIPLMLPNVGAQGSAR